jgi:hypothetical protein
MIREKITGDIVEEVFNTDEFIRMQNVIDQLGTQDESASVEMTDRSSSGGGNETVINSNFKEPLNFLGDS